MKKVFYCIYKKQIGNRIGEYWDDAKSLSDAKKKLQSDYDENFRIVKMTLETVTVAKPKKVR